MFIDEHRDRFGVEPICRVLDVSASAYYQRARAERSARAIQDERLIEVIRVTHKRNYEAYGYRRTWKALLRAGERVPRCQVQRLMRQHGIQGAKRRGKPWRTTKSRSRTLSAGPIWSTVTSPLRRRTGCGSGTCPICAAGRASSTSRSSSTCSAAASSAGSSPSHAHRPRPRRARNGARHPRAWR